MPQTQNPPVVLSIETHGTSYDNLLAKATATAEDFFGPERTFTLTLQDGNVGVTDPTPGSENRFGGIFLAALVA